MDVVAQFTEKKLRTTIVDGGRVEPSRCSLW